MTYALFSLSKCAFCVHVLTALQIATYYFISQYLSELHFNYRFKLKVYMHNSEGNDMYARRGEM